MTGGPKKLRMVPIHAFLEALGEEATGMTVPAAESAWRTSAGEWVGAFLWL